MTTTKVGQYVIYNALTDGWKQLIAGKTILKVVKADIGPTQSYSQVYNELTDTYHHLPNYVLKPIYYQLEKDIKDLINE